MNRISGIGRLFMTGIPGPTLNDETKLLLEELNPLSIIFFGRNIISPEQLAGLISDITAFLGRKPVFCCRSGRRHSNTPRVRFYCNARTNGSGRRR